MSRACAGLGLEQVHICPSSIPRNSPSRWLRGPHALPEKTGQPDCCTLPSRQASQMHTTDIMCNIRIALQRTWPYPLHVQARGVHR